MLPEKIILQKKHQSGLTLVELIVAFSIMLILSTIALPLAQVKIQREKEKNLRTALSTIRKAIDRYKDMADSGKLGQIDPDTFGYPPNLETLVEGVSMRVGTSGNPFGNNIEGAKRNETMRGRTRISPTRNREDRSTEGFGSRSFSSDKSSKSRLRDRTSDVGNQKVRFLRKIPLDPMTGYTNWGVRAVEDDPGAFAWSGENVFDIYSRSMDVALDGTRYNEW